MIDKILPQLGRQRSCMLDTWVRWEQTNPFLISDRSLTTLTTIHPLTPTLGKAWTLMLAMRTILCFVRLLYCISVCVKNCNLYFSCSSDSTLNFLEHIPWI